MLNKRILAALCLLCSFGCYLHFCLTALLLVLYQVWTGREGTFLSLAAVQLLRQALK